VIVCDNLVKIYRTASLEVVALQGLSLTVAPGEMLAIVGTSGSGKTTLLNILGGLDWPSAGYVTVDGHNLAAFSRKALSRFRRERVGFVWQQPARNLVYYLSAVENVAQAMALGTMGKRNLKDRTQELLEAVDLWEQRQQRPFQLSGGQQQRLAIAVALAHRPQVLLADEPTGEVDTETAQSLFRFLRRLNCRHGLTTVIATHDQEIIDRVDRVVAICDGRTSSEMIRDPSELRAALANGNSGALRGEALETQWHAMVDRSGVIHLPAGYRRRLGIDGRAKLTLTENSILIEPIRDGESPTHSTISVPDHSQELSRRSLAWRRRGWPAFSRGRE
jgi:ABC-type lipoprotein export system ATPase subunit